MTRDDVLREIVSRGFKSEGDDPATNGSYYERFSKGTINIWIGNTFVEAEYRRDSFNFKDRFNKVEDLNKYLNGNNETTD